MFAWIIQISIISIIFIFLVHHLFGFFKSTLTVPKIKDLVNSPYQKYQNIFDTINTNSFSSSNSTTSLIDINTRINSLPSDNNSYSENSYTEIDLLPPSPSQSTGLDGIVKDNMKNELKSFLKKQLNTNGDSRY